MSVGGSVARYLPRLRAEDDAQVWAKNGAAVLIELLSLNEADRASLAAQGIAWANSFDADAAIEGYLRVYRRVIERENTHPR